MRKSLFLLVALAAMPAFAKSLHWRSLDVAARLDRDGRLHVVERQAMVFDGDWNGGERTFRIGPGQKINLESITRVEDGSEHPLTQGDLGTVDHYGFTSPTVLRWRSRTPSDPPFDNREITYVLKYTATGVLRRTEGVYYFNHDFAFADRAGVIEHYSLRFDIDPVWQGASSPVEIERQTLVPGKSVIVPLRLTFAGSGEPADVLHTVSPKVIYAVLALFIFGLLLVINDFVAAENAKGRFARVDLSSIDEAWLAEHLFTLSPEAAGAAMDGNVGAGEVAAMLARMTQEKKISSAVETRKNLFTSRQVLTMELLVDRNTLSPAEQKLVRALFQSAKTTDTDKIREHYKSIGFDPSKIVESSVGPELQKLPGWQKKARRANWLIDVAVLLGTLVLMIIAATLSDNDNAIAAWVIVAGALTILATAIAANVNARGLDRFTPRFIVVALCLTPLVWFVVSYSLDSIDYVLHLFTPVAMAAWALAIVKLTLDWLRSPEAVEKIAFRKGLYAARDWFIRELRSPHPRLRDEWYPYLLAFGLGRNVDRWFGSYGTAAAASSTNTFGRTSTSMSSSSSTSTSEPAFTGGGGAFGGAGASGGWAVAATAIGAGVSAPSSSSGGSGGGGGGGGGGGSSSGGGGGGGW